jgi:hypothetical protein
MTMTPHAEILSVLAAEFPKWVPKDHVGWPLKQRATGIFFENPDDPSEFWALQHFAHLAIEKAAWGVVRWWCKRHSWNLSICDIDAPIEDDSDMTEVLLCCRGDDGYPVNLGRGPTDSDALLAALKYIAGEMGKEKK